MRMSKKILATVCLSLMMTTAYSIELPKADVVKFNTAVKAYRMNNNTKALRLFTQLYNDYPQNQEIKNNYAVVLFGSGKLEKAEEVLSSIIESNKDVNIAYKNLNNIYDYAAAKAYSNALGTDKEVKPKKLQLIEQLITPEASLALTSKAAEKPSATVVEHNKVASNVISATPASAPFFKPVSNDATDNVNTWANTWSEADVNSYVATALKDVNEPIGTPSVLPAVLNQSASQKGSASASKVAITKPAVVAQVSAKEVPPQANEIAVVENAINNWAQAWSQGDAERYITYYEPSFTIGRMSHKTWLRTRKQRINPSRNIEVTLSELVVTPSSTDDTMVANFKQSYKANHYQDNTTKQLIWKKIGDKWFIQKETSLN